MVKRKRFPVSHTYENPLPCFMVTTQHKFHQPFPACIFSNSFKHFNIYKVSIVFSKLSLLLLCTRTLLLNGSANITPLVLVYLVEARLNAARLN